MKQTAIVYFSVNQNTRLLALAIARGVEMIDGCKASLIRIVGDDIRGGRFQSVEIFTTLADSHAIVFGSPTYMGSAAAQMKAFMDASSDQWASQRWSGKIAGGFTSGGCPCGDKLFTLQQFAIFAAQHGMHWVNLGDLPSANELNRLGSSLGVMGLNPTSEEALAMHSGDEQTSVNYGKRIAGMTVRHSFDGNAAAPALLAQ